MAVAIAIAIAIAIAFAIAVATITSRRRYEGVDVVAHRHVPICRPPPVNQRHVPQHGARVALARAEAHARHFAWRRAHPPRLAQPMQRERTPVAPPCGRRGNARGGRRAGVRVPRGRRRQQQVAPAPVPPREGVPQPRAFEQVGAVRARGARGCHHVAPGHAHDHAVLQQVGGQAAEVADEGGVIAMLVIVHDTQISVVLGGGLLHGLLAGLALSLIFLSVAQLFLAYLVAEVDAEQHERDHDGC